MLGKNKTINLLYDMNPHASPVYVAGCYGSEWPQCRMARTTSYETEWRLLTHSGLTHSGLTGLRFLRGHSGLRPRLAGQPTC